MHLAAIGVNGLIKDGPTPLAASFRMHAEMLSGPLLQCPALYGRGIPFARCLQYLLLSNSHYMQWWLLQGVGVGVPTQQEILAELSCLVKIQPSSKIASWRGLQHF